MFQAIKDWWYKRQSKQYARLVVKRVRTQPESGNVLSELVSLKQAIKFWGLTFTDAGITETEFNALWEEAVTQKALNRDKYISHTLRVLRKEISPNLWPQMSEWGAFETDPFWLEGQIKESGRSLEEYGTSPEELHRFQREWHKKSAAETLDELRYRTSYERHGMLMSMLVEHLQKGELPPEEIGTTREEIEQLRVKLYAKP
ncbi:MAG: hypothetical protein V4681_03310 [Patescibacteria group bacterium]